MALEFTQLSLADESDEYKAFVEKFKTKNTTDDCYTPAEVYDAVAEWVEKEYKLGRSRFVRPFFPCGDYEREIYPHGCVVVDNPPFSILSKICAFYCGHGVPFFLFAPSLRITSAAECCLIACGVDVQFENGAVVPLNFVTNLESAAIRTAPTLYAAIKNAEDARRKETTRQLPRYEYPLHVITAAKAEYFCKYGVKYRVEREDVFFVRKLDDQARLKKSIFGGGYLLSEKAAAEKAAAEKAAAEKAAAEKAAAEKWTLSDRELRIVEQLGR